MTAMQHQKDEAAIRNLIANWSRAVERKDAEGIVEAYTPHTVLYDVTLPVVGKDAIKALWERCFPFFPDRFRSEHQDVSVVVEDNLAIVYGFHRFVPGPADHPCGQFQSRVTAVFQRIEGEWRLIHEHASIPFKMEGSAAEACAEEKEPSAAGNSDSTAHPAARLKAMGLGRGLTRHHRLQSRRLEGGTTTVEFGYWTAQLTTATT